MLRYWIWLSTRSGIGPRTCKKIAAHFSTPEEAFYAGKDEYAKAGLTAREAGALADKDLERPRQILEECGEKGVHLLAWSDAAYPERLRNIPDPPVLLYYKGVFPNVDDEPLVAVIGSRKSSLYGLSVAKRLGFQIASCGGIVVSGAAAGGDSMAMQGAVSAGRPVVGVLGCGVDVVYPRSSRHLYEDVASRGCLLSEYPPGTSPSRFTFPARNRIISGLSLGVVVVEAPAKSGTMITVEDALEQGRDVFAVPGNINYDSCAGSNRLLKEGAILVENGWDVMREYEPRFPTRIREVHAGQKLTLSPDELRQGLSPVRTQRSAGKTAPVLDKRSVDDPSGRGYIDIEALPGLSEDEGLILAALRSGPLCADELIAACGGRAGQILSSLTLLEIKNHVERLPGNRYELAKKK